MQFFAFFCCLCLTATRANALSSLPKVVVLSFSGFRVDLIEDPKRLPYLYRWYLESAKPNYLIPVFPTKTPVNLFSVATGLYAEDHGVIDNCAIDELPGQCEYEQYDKWLEPIWIENQKQKGGISAVMMWPGSQQEYIGGKPIYHKEYDNNNIPSYKDRINTIIDWLKNKKEPANLVMAHFGDLEKVLHETGTRSLNTEEELKKIENIIKSFTEKLKKIDKDETINLVVLGSQGIYTAGYSYDIDLEEILKSEKCTFTAMGANAIVTPEQGEFQTVYATLKACKSGKYRVYKKGDAALDNWHLQKLPLFNENDKNIFLVAKLSYYFPNDYIKSVLEKGSVAFTKHLTSFGIDGYSNEVTQMHTFMAATGPRFKHRYRSAAFETIDIYPLLRELLGLTEDTSERQRKMIYAVRELVVPAAMRPSSYEKGVDKKDGKISICRTLINVVTSIYGPKSND